MGLNAFSLFLVKFFCACVSRPKMWRVFYTATKAGERERKLGDSTFLCCNSSGDFLTSGLRGSGI